jgi:hypothetical protein
LWCLSLVHPTTGGILALRELSSRTSNIRGEKYQGIKHQQKAGSKKALRLFSLLGKVRILQYTVISFMICNQYWMSLSLVEDVMSPSKQVMYTYTVKKVNLFYIISSSDCQCKPYVRSQHRTTQCNLRGGRGSSVE